MERISAGASFWIISIKALVSGSLHGFLPGESSVILSLSKVALLRVVSALQFDVGKLRFKSTPFALPLVPKETPSGFAHRIKAVVCKGSVKCLSTLLKRNVVSLSSP